MLYRYGGVDRHSHVGSVTWDMWLTERVRAGGCIARKQMVCQEAVWDGGVHIFMQGCSMLSIMCREQGCRHAQPAAAAAQWAVASNATSTVEHAGVELRSQLKPAASCLFYGVHCRTLKCSLQPAHFYC